MSTEVELFEFQDIPSRPSIRGYVGTDGAAKVSAGGVDMPTYATDSAGNVTGLVGPGGENIPIRPHAQAMTAIAIGNSIATPQKYGGFGTDWITKAEIHIANALAGSPLVFSRITASTRADQYGVYGYGGQTLPTINDDLPTQLWSPLASAGVVPQVVFGLALLENDIAGGATVAAMTKSLSAFMRDAFARYPSAIVLLATPRPSFSYNTPSIVAAYQGIRDYILSLDNGSNVFVSRLDTYENPAVPGTPLGTSGAPIYTDNSVHPNAKGAMRNARVIAATLRRIASAWVQRYYCLGTNMALTGTGAASGTNVSGTVPTSVTVSGTANGTFTCVAEQPGLLLTINANSTGSEPPVDLASTNIASVAIAGGASTQLSPFAEIEIVSGAENISWLSIRPRFTGSGGGNVLSEFVKRNTNDAMPEFVNGDVLLWRVPPRMAADITGVVGNFSGCQIYIEYKTTLPGGQFTIRVRSAGVGVVVP